MAESIRHARSVSPWLIPNKGGTAGDLHALTNTNKTSSQDEERISFVGTSDECVDKSLPEVTVSFPQAERGEIDTYLKLANLSSEPVGGIDLLDFSSALVDYYEYQRDSEAGTIERTVWVPKLAISSLSLDIADPEARVERTIELTSDNKIILGYGQKFGIHKKVTAGSGVSGSYAIDLSDPEPIVDPNESGVYVLRLDRTRDGETETLTLGTDYTFNTSTDDITVLAADGGDVYNVYYSAASFGTGGDPTTPDPLPTPCFIKADSVTVLISDGNEEIELTKLTSLSITATINRIDESVIGSDEKVLREIDDTPVDVSFGGRVKNSEILEAFMGHLDDDWGIVDIKKFLSNVRVTVKLYSDSTKSTFLLGYQVDGLSFQGDDEGFDAGDFGAFSVDASSSNLLITTTEADLT